MNLMTDVDFLFIYGTLLPVFSNPASSWLKTNAEPISEGYMPGLLYKVADYPGAVYLHKGVTKVYGLIVKMNNTADVLSHLDKYEGVNPEYPSQGEYIRQVVTIAGCDGIKRKCWVYLYNLDVRQLELIKSGDFINYYHCNF